MNITTKPVTQSDTNALYKKTLDELEAHILSLLPPNKEYRVLHVSSNLAASGLTHFHRYDRKKYNGFTFGLVTDKNTGAVELYVAACPREDTYDKLYGRLELARIVKINLEEKDSGIIRPRYSPLLVDLLEAHKSNAVSLDRSIVDWYIKKHINTGSSVVGTKTVTREFLTQLEASVVAILEEQLQNSAGLRIVWEYNDTFEDTKPSRKKSIAEKTKLVVVIKDPKQLDQASIATLALGLTTLDTTVVRYVGDSPNRLIARLAALTKLKKSL